MKHYLEEIQYQFDDLSEEAKKHIQQCEICQKEKILMNDIEQSIQTKAEVLVPYLFKEQILLRIQKPLYKIWQSLIAAFVLMVSPFFIRQLISNIYSINFNPTAFIFLSIFFGTTASIILIPLSISLYKKYDSILEKFDENPLDFISHSIKFL